MRPFLKGGAGRCISMAMMVIALAACGRGITSTPGEAPNLEKWAAEVKARPAPPLDPLPVMQQFETFEYAAQGLRDPGAAVVSGAAAEADDERTAARLERGDDELARAVAGSAPWV